MEFLFRAASYEMQVAWTLCELWANNSTKKDGSPNFLLCRARALRLAEHHQYDERTPDRELSQMILLVAGEMNP